MSETLDILSRYVTPETLENYKESIRLCVLCDQDQLETMIAQELSKIGELDTIDVVTGIHAATEYMLRDIIKGYDVEVAEEINLKDLNCVLEALLEIPFYVDKEALNRICESEADDIEKFSEMMQLVTEYTSEKALTILESVSGTLIDKVLETVGIVDSVVKIDYPDIVLRLKHFLEFIKTKELIGSILIYNDIVLGMPFERYIAYFAPRIDEWSVEQAAREILYILYMSRDGYENPATVFDKYAPELFHDLQQQNKVTVALLNLVSNFTVYLTSAQAQEFEKNEQV